MIRHCLAAWVAATIGVGPVCPLAGEQPSAAASRLCLVDGRQVSGDLYVDVAGVRLYACNEECLKKITGDSAYVRLISESKYQPERIPIHRSREWTEDELLKDMALVEGGRFVRRGRYFTRRGKTPEPVEHDRYTVEVSSFYIDRHEVTFEEYCRFLNDGNEKYATGGIRRGENGEFAPPRDEWARFPVRGTNYFQAGGYAEWAGKRLPTEAEWEYAHGGSEGRKYPWGDEEPGETRANFGPMFKGLKPVGSFPQGQTPEGVFDLAGNIGEWCSDYYDEDYYRKPSRENLIEDPQGPESGYLRVYRLGCQCEGATTKDLLGNLRCHASPFRGAGCVGFRCVRSVQPKQ